MPTVCEHIKPGNSVRRAGPGISPLWHYHAEIEANLVVAGRGGYFLRDAHYDLSPGSLVWMLPNQSHRLLPGPDLQMWVVTCTGERLDRAFYHDVAGHADRVLARDDAITLDRLFTHVSQDSDQPELYRTGIDYALRSALHLSMAGPEAARAPLHPAVLTALRVFRETPDIPNADALAARCGVSRDYLRELLVEQTGRGFVEWRNRFRLERFQMHYPESGDLLTAALDAGFGSYVQFHRVFQSIVGTTPGDWVVGGRKVVGAPLADFAPAPDRASGRMVWYALADLVYEDSRRWISPDFARCLEADPDGGDDYRPMPSHVASSFDLNRFAADHLAEIEAKFPASGKRLSAAASQQVDIFADHAEMLSLWGYDLSDIAPIIAAHIITGWRAIHARAVPDRKTRDAFARRVAAALHASGSFAEAGVEDRQRSTAALAGQFFIFRMAVVGAYNLGRDDLIATIAAAARRTMVATYGVDPPADLIAPTSLA